MFVNWEAKGDVRPNDLEKVVVDFCWICMGMDAYQREPLWDGVHMSKQRYLKMPRNKKLKLYT